MLGTQVAREEALRHHGILGGHRILRREQPLAADHVGEVVNAREILRAEVQIPAHHPATRRQHELEHKPTREGGLVKVERPRAVLEDPAAIQIPVRRPAERDRLVRRELLGD